MTGIRIIVSEFHAADTLSVFNLHFYKPKICTSASGVRHTGVVACKNPSACGGGVDTNIIPSFVTPEEIFIVIRCLLGIYVFFQ